MLRKVKMPPQRALRRATKGKSRSAFESSVQLDSDSSLTVQEQLRELVKSHGVRMLDLFRDWDEDQSGTITLTEFRRAISALGYEAPSADVAAVFDMFDRDKSGTIELKELNKELRRGVDIQLDAALLDGAAGEITVGARNAIRRSVEERRIQLDVHLSLIHI